MMTNTNTARKLHIAGESEAANASAARKMRAAEGRKSKSANDDAPCIPSSFRLCPESRKLLEEMIFNHRFSERYAGRTNMVGVNEVAAVAFHNRQHCIGTTSLSSCAGFALFDPDSKVGAAAHVRLSQENPALEPVKKILSMLVDAAGMVGGRKYIAYAFNVREGARSWNAELSAFVNGLMANLMDDGVVSHFEHRDERQFVINAKTGDIFTGRE